MHNFKILKNRAQYRVCDHPFKLIFIGAMSVRPQPIVGIPAKVWKFKSVKDIIYGQYSADLLVGKFFVIHSYIYVLFNLLCSFTF